MTAPESERRDTRSREQILARVRAEFSDMAGLSLTLPQARRLFHLEHELCMRLFDELVDRGFLKRNADGSYSNCQTYIPRADPR